MKFRDLKLGTKQIIGFGCILLIMAGVNVFSIHKMTQLKIEIDEISRNWLPRALAISDINKNTTDFRIKQLQYAFAVDPGEQETYKTLMISYIDQIEKNRNTYEALKSDSEARNLYSDSERALYDQFERQLDRYLDLSISHLMLSRENENEEAVALLNDEASDVFNQLSATLLELVNVNKDDAQEAAVRAEETHHASRVIITSLLIATIVLSIFIAGMLVRYIAEPVSALDEAAHSVAAGNLDVTLPVRSRDEIGSLAGSFNRMTTSLREATQKMQQQREALEQANSDLEDKSQRLEKQKTEIEQTNLRLEKQKIEITKKNVELLSTMEELRNTQQQLLMKEKMAALGDLVAGIAHEINNPIGTVTSSTDVTGRCLQKIEIVLEQSCTIEQLRSNPQLPKAIKIIKDNIRVTLTAGHRIATIVKSLKNFAGLDEATYRVVDIHDGLDSTLTLLESEFRGRIEIEKQYGELPKVGCYPSQLNQVFMNLLKNAVQAIENKGVVRIQTRRQDGRVEIKISDSGRGIPAEKLSRNFDFGFSSGSERVKMGSGLVTAFNIIQKHDGEILANSEPGKGSTFTVLLPVR